MHKMAKQLALVGVMLMAAVLACNANLPSNPQPPIPSLQASTGDADAFEQQFKQAISQASSTGKFTATISQQQLSSWLVLRAPDFAKKQGYEWPLNNVQAGLNDGKITLYGVINEQNLPQTPAQIIFTPSIDGNGELAVKVDSGQVGVVGVPADILGNLNKAIKDMLTSQLSQIKGRYKLDNLAVANGSLTVSGQVVQ